MVGTQYSTQKRLGVSGADTVAVSGIGPMGAAGILVAKARGARVIAIDVLESRLDDGRAASARTRWSMPARATPWSGSAS